MTNEEFATRTVQVVNNVRRELAGLVALHALISSGNCNDAAGKAAQIGNKFVEKRGPLITVEDVMNK